MHPSLTFMVVCLLAAAGVPVGAYAEESDGEGKYVSDVFIAYGKTEEKAAKWLTDNGWEPVSAFGAGQLALAGIGGLLIGALGSAFVLRTRRRKEEKEAA